MLAADFYHMVRSALTFLSHESVTYGRSPEVSATAFRAQGPDLHLTPLMDMDFAIIRSLVRRSCLISGSCSSPRAFARRFLRTPFCIGALALCYPSPPSGWGKTSTSELSHMLGTQRAPGVGDPRPHDPLANSWGPSATGPRGVQFPPGTNRMLSDLRLPRWRVIRGLPLSWTRRLTNLVTRAS